MTVAECKQRVSWREFCEWRAFYRRDPWDGYRIDANVGHVVATLIGLLGKRSVSLSDAMLEFGPGKEQTPEEMERGLRFALGL